MRQRILVLGADGFIGRAVCRMWADGPEDSELLLHFRSSPAASVLPNFDAEWHALDLERADRADYVRMFDRLAPDVVINCTGLTAGEPDALRSANVGIVVKLVDALEGRTGVHLVQLGSAAEYGTQAVGEAVSESVYATPLSAYGVTKFEATQMCLAAAAERRVTVTVLRVFNPLGRNSPARTLPGRAAVEIREALEHRRRSIRLGPLDSYRDYIDTRDVARAALLAGRGPAGGGAVLNVGRGEAVLSRDVIRSLARIAGYDGAIEESDDGSSRSARLSWQCADIRAIGERLGWRPRYRLEDSLRDLWDGVQGASGLTPPLTTQGSNGL